MDRKEKQNHITNKLYHLIEINQYTNQDEILDDLNQELEKSVSQPTLSRHLKRLKIDQPEGQQIYKLPEAVTREKERNELVSQISALNIEEMEAEHYKMMMLPVQSTDRYFHQFVLSLTTYLSEQFSCEVDFITGHSGNLALIIPASQYEAIKQEIQYICDMSQE